MKRFTKLLMLCTICFLPASVMAQTIRYVKVGGTGDGNGSWANATANLQGAIDDSAAGDQVWVAAGTYYPTKKLTPDGGPRDRTFILKEGVKVYGGFLGDESLLSQRVKNAQGELTNETILSGDFPTGEPEEDPGNLHTVDVVVLDPEGIITGITGNSTNAHHVVVSYNNTAETVLDGFTISGGNADLATSVVVDGETINANAGAGIFLRKSSPILSNLVISANHAVGSGAGVRIIGGKQNGIGQPVDKLTFSNSVIEYNYGSDAGASIYAGSSGVGVYISSLTGYSYDADFNGLIFRYNYNLGFGGGLRVHGEVNLTLEDAEFEKNKANLGGGIYVQSNNSLNIINTTFKDNIAMARGGAIEGNSSANVVIKGTSFTGNTAATGGAIAVLPGSASPAKFIIENCTFQENTSTSGATGGGAIYGSTASAFEIKSDSKFIANTAVFYGGAIYVTSSASYLKVNGASFLNNEALAGGAVFLAANNVENSIVNAVLYGNKAGNGGAFTLQAAPAVIRNSTFYGNISNNAAGTAAGGALRLTNSTSSILTLYNSIILGNTANVSGAEDVSRAGSSASASIANSLTQGATGTNVRTDALASNVFINTTDPNHADFLKLKPVTNNPAINAGDNDLVPRIYNNDEPPLDITLTTATDLAGAMRFNGTVDLGAYENHTPLPISLSYFSAKANVSSVVLTWATATETNNKHFVLERSTDGFNFSPVATIPTKGDGANYSFTDFAPANGVNYYKLSQVDLDGTIVSYDPKAVNFSLQKTAHVNVYPNPVVANKVTVSLGGNQFTKLQLLNINGQILQSETLSLNDLEKTVDVSRLGSGVYFIKLTDGQKVVTKKFAKP